MPPTTTGTTARWRRIPWVSATLSLLVAVTALVPLDAIRNAADYGPVADARLERSLAYSILGPISSMFDALSLLSVQQIYGFTLWAIVLYAIARIVRRRFRRVSWKREVVYGVASFAGLLIAYGAAVIMPRPMAKLIVTRLDVISVDFHTHTKYSHDGRPGWSAQDVQDWHTASGFHVAYITDHRSYDGVRDGLALDSALVGEEAVTTLLPGLEVFWHGEHINILNAGVRYRGLTTADFVSIDDTALAYASIIANNEPVLVYTIPGNLSMIIPHSGPTSAGVRAIEIVVGAPRGITQIKRDHDRIVQLADSLNLALVAGSNNHGWGRVAPGWTLMRIPGVWRTYKPDSLADVIDQIIRVAGRNGTEVVERTTAGASPVAIGFTLPVVLWTVLRTLSSAERIAWLAWIWLPVLIAWIIRRRSTMT